MIYLDYNATTPIAPEVAAAMEPFLRAGLQGRFGNPSSGHMLGRQTRAAVDDARGQVSALVGCRTDELVFTSGGTESNNHAIRGAVRARREAAARGQAAAGDHLITSAVEHPAVLAVCEALVAEEGLRLTVLPVDRRGQVSPEDLDRALDQATILVTVMHANNEVGTIQPIAELAHRARAKGALMHTDAAQSAGKIPIDVGTLGVDLLSLAGHKLYAPKGVGALFVRRGVALAPLMYGAGHESGRRPGTENVLGIVGLGRACGLVADRLEAHSAALQGLRDRLHDGLVARLGSAAVVLNGDPERRLPNTLSLGFVGCRADALLAALGDEALAVSSGAACHAAGETISAVLTAMQVPRDRALGTLRLSVGRFTTADEIDQAIMLLAAAVELAKSR